MNYPHACKCCIDFGRLHIAVHHLALQLIQIEPQGDWLLSPLRDPLAMNGPLFPVVAVDFVFDLLGLICEYPQVDLSLLSSDDWVKPDGIAELKRAGAGWGGPRQFNSGARHLQAGNAGQNLLQPAALYAYVVIGQEELLPTESRTVALLAQIRRVAVQQRVQHPRPNHPLSRRSVLHTINTVKLSCKRISRQTYQ